MTPTTAVRADAGLLRRGWRYCLARGGWVDLLFILCMLEALTSSMPLDEVAPSATRQMTLVYALIGATLLAAPWRRLPSWVSSLVLASALMPLVGLLVWIAALGTQSGYAYWAYWHPWILITGFLPFAVAHGPARWHHWRLILIGFGTAAAVLQAVVLLGLFLDWTSQETSQYGDFYGMRPITGTMALLVVFAFVLVVSGGSRNGSAMALGLFLGISVVVAQHRSAWASLIVVLVLLGARSLRDHADRASWVPLLGTAGFFALSLLLPALTSISLLPSSASGADAEPGLPDAATSTHSLEWRLEMWRTRLTATRQMVNTLFGGVLRVTPVKVPGTGVMNPGNSAHNMAVDVYTMLGIVGLAVVGTLFVVAAALRSDRLDPFAIMLWALFVFGVFYNWPEWSWLIVGTALASRGEPVASTTTAGRIYDDSAQEVLAQTNAVGDRPALRSSLSNGVLRPK